MVGLVTERYIARFNPEAWQNDNAIEVDPEGEQEWDCTEFALANQSYVEALFRRDSDDPIDNEDRFQRDPAAPQWVREWHGPFTIHITKGGDSVSVTCACGHSPDQHVTDENLVQCLVHGDNTYCDYADPAVIAADRWDEGYIEAVRQFIPPELQFTQRVLWMLNHMPKDNPYREEQVSE